MREAIVLLSGGQDSTTALAWAQQEFNVEAITFHYGQRHWSKEMFAAKKIAELAKVPHRVFNIAAPPAPSALTEHQEDISSPHQINPSLPASFVPGRNMLFLTYAAAYAYGKGIQTLVIGVSEADYSGYPDCRRETIGIIRDALCAAMDSYFSIFTPLVSMSKAGEIHLMECLGHLDWLTWTHTCYEGKFPPCGQCPACRLREKGFREAGIPDPLIERSKLYDNAKTPSD